MAALAAAGPPTIEQEGAAVLPHGSDPSPNPAVALEDLGPAPELTGITAWINSDPLTLASLRGKVVLVHFWTFGCINCIHVQPYVKAWYDRYAADGFVVVGVHTPELSFERDIGNVRDAVAKDDVRFPVAFDPAYATWNAYRNQLLAGVLLRRQERPHPAHALRRGRLRRIRAGHPGAARRACLTGLGGATDRPPVGRHRSAPVGATDLGPSHRATDRRRSVPNAHHLSVRAT